MKGELSAELRNRVLHHEAQSCVMGFYDAKDLSNILNDLQSNGCEIENLQTSRASLEDLFIKVTQSH